MLKVFSKNQKQYGYLVDVIAFPVTVQGLDANKRLVEQRSIQPVAVVALEDGLAIGPLGDLQPVYTAEEKKLFSREPLKLEEKDELSDEIQADV